MIPDHVGVGATRSMHPRTLGLFSNLASQVLEHQIQVENSGLFKTKRQGAQENLSAIHQHAVRLTQSCPRFTWLDRPCGVCTSCMLRQLALSSTRFEEPSLSRQQWNPALAAMALQSETLRRELSLEAAEFVASHPEIYEALRYSELFGTERKRSNDMVTSLYKAHVREVDAFLVTHQLGDTKSSTSIAPLPVRRAHSA